MILLAEGFALPHVAVTPFFLLFSFRGVYFEQEEIDMKIVSMSGAVTIPQLLNDKASVI